MEMEKETKPFWERKRLDELTNDEWEALCDRCGRCCLEKLEDKETGVVYYTSVTCSHLDTWECRCLNYDDRHQVESDCLVIAPDMVEAVAWLPATCAYRCLMEGRDLEWWHPLVSGSYETVHEAGISVRDKVISASYVDVEELQAYIIDVDI